MDRRDVGKVVFVNEAMGYHVKVYATRSLFSASALKTRLVQRLCKKVPYKYIMEGLNGEMLKSIPRGHFTTYMRCTARRYYEKAVMRDLDFIHEISHDVSWAEGGAQESPALSGRHETWEDWAKRMIDSELFASIMSEVMPHIFMPGVREAAFTFPIWADRFLKDKRLMKQIKNGKISFKKLFKKIAKERLRVLEGGRHSNDPVEMQVSGYYDTNQTWVRMFGEEMVGFGEYAKVFAFRCVENHLGHFQNPEKHGVWLRAVTPTAEQLEALGIPDTYQFPLGVQAYTFEKIFGEYLAKFNNAVFSH